MNTDRVVVDLGNRDFVGGYAWVVRLMVDVNQLLELIRPENDPVASKKLERVPLTRVMAVGDADATGGSKSSGM